MVIGLTRLGAKVYYSNAGEVADSTFKYLFYDMNWLFFCGWMFLFCIIVVIVVSPATKAPTAEKIQGLVFGTATKEQKAATRASWNHWDIIHTVIISGYYRCFLLVFLVKNKPFLQPSLWERLKESKNSLANGKTGLL